MKNVVTRWNKIATRFELIIKNNNSTNKMETGSSNSGSNTSTARYVTTRPNSCCSCVRFIRLCSWYYIWYYMLVLHVGITQGRVLHMVVHVGSTCWYYIQALHMVSSHLCLTVLHDIHYSIMHHTSLLLLLQNRVLVVRGMSHVYLILTYILSTYFCLVLLWQIHGREYAFIL